MENSSNSLSQSYINAQKTYHVRPKSNKQLMKSKGLVDREEQINILKDAILMLSDQYYPRSVKSFVPEVPQIHCLTGDVECTDSSREEHKLVEGAVQTGMSLIALRQVENCTMTERDLLEPVEPLKEFHIRGIKSVVSDEVEPFKEDFNNIQQALALLGITIPGLTNENFKSNDKQKSVVDNANPANQIHEVSSIRPSGMIVNHLSEVDKTSNIDHNMDHLKQTYSTVLLNTSLFSIKDFEQTENKIAVKGQESLIKKAFINRKIKYMNMHSKDVKGQSCFTNLTSIEESPYEEVILNNLAETNISDIEKVTFMNSNRDISSQSSTGSLCETRIVNDISEVTNMLQILGIKVPSMMKEKVVPKKSQKKLFDLPENKLNKLLHKSSAVEDSTFDQYSDSSDMDNEQVYNQAKEPKLISCNRNKTKNVDNDYKYDIDLKKKPYEAIDEQSLESQQYNVYFNESECEVPKLKQQLPPQRFINMCPVEESDITNPHKTRSKLRSAIYAEKIRKQDNIRKNDPTMHFIPPPTIKDPRNYYASMTKLKCTPRNVEIISKSQPYEKTLISKSTPYDPYDERHIPQKHSLLSTHNDIKNRNTSQDRKHIFERKQLVSAQKICTQIDDTSFNNSARYLYGNTPMTHPVLHSSPRQLDSNTYKITSVSDVDKPTSNILEVYSQSPLKFDSREANYARPIYIQTPSQVSTIPEDYQDANDY